MINVDPAEIEKFSQLAHRWWDPGSEFKPLHEINPLRLDHIDRLAGLSGRRVLDVGCGGGILSEAMAARGAVVTGIDMAERPLKVAQLHLHESGLSVDYRKTSVEALAQSEAGQFDIVTCMELLEHVPDPASTVTACARVLKPGGWCFFATINRNPKSYLFAVIGAEYVLRLLPKGTHEYAKFIRPSELAAWCRTAGLAVVDITGMSYNPFSKTYSLGKNTSVNYILCARLAG
ncbi:MAG TPA: bifunctional 2-polyprenyl-6-hydroxyphenol methylase/3-demethylubiquinol 3-O-methyltransferase UbiG [Burkholderiales bacterium]|jgi:2-polyprenyl-6-hydroxyphenyl methylase/3-demethylubiquinone-9 3-methyltransferase|nr:bifunctional 2-polyprenyl-6-hydroxyphenol methylase/3-demethylubiquinol 3-O-methyltransferase UbiG [Burkholderiales bacterium]